MAVKQSNSKGKQEAEVQKSATNVSKKQQAVALLQGKFGKEIVVGGKVQVDRIPTGLIGFDRQLGGGWPVGRIGEFYGPEASGKTTAAQLVIEAHQKRNLQTYFIDAEQALDRSYSAKLGVNVDEMIVTQPDNAEQALDAMLLLAENSMSDLTVVDSVSALTPKAEIEGDMGASHMGLQARLMNQALRKVNPFTSKNKNSLIFINQIRMKIGVMFGNPETTSGGNALKFYASVRNDVRRVSSIKDGEKVIGNRVKFKMVKNKVGQPYTEREYDLYFNEGYDRVADLFDLACEVSVINKAGSHFSYNGAKLGQGRDNALIFMRSSMESTKEILTLTVKALVAKDELPESYLEEIDFVLSLMKFGKEQLPAKESPEVEAKEKEEKSA
jgi:recombination protein RecA